MSYYNTGRKQHPSGSRGGRGRGRGSFSFSDPVASPIEQDRNIMQGLVSVPLQTIVKPGEQEMSNISTDNLKYIGSYNWTNCDNPTIMVPGSPPEWQNRATPYKVQPDVGVHFVDQNNFRSPSSMLLPLFTAVEALAHEAGESAVNWQEVDFVTDRNCLRNILRWIGNSDREFRIDMQMAGEKTVLLSRWSKRTRERFPGYTFGFNFEKASTKPAPGCADTSGHHRIITYDMGGFKMVVRFEVDAFLRDPKKPASKASSSTNVDDLINSLAAVNLSAGKLPAAKDVGKDEESISAGLPGSLSTIKATRGGSEIPQPSIVEMCTRSVARAADFDWVDSYPQLFLSQTVHHFMGVHEKGLFTEVKHRSLHSSELKDIEEDLQPDFKKLVRTLQIIQGIVKKHGERGRLSLVYKGKGLLELYERTSTDGCIPDDVMGLFD